MDVSASADPGKQATAAAAGFLMAQRLSTRAAYAADLRQWFDWCAGFGLDALAARRTHVDAWVARLSTVARPSTMARKVSAVRGFYIYAIAERYLSASPVPATDSVLHLPAVPRTAQTPNLDREEIAALLAAAAERGSRDTVVVTLLLYQGLRVGELCALDIDDADLTGHARQVLRVGPEGPAQRSQLIAPAAAAALMSYLDSRLSAGQPHETFTKARILSPRAETAALIKDGRGQRLTRYQVEWIVERCARAAGIDRGVTPHWLRQACTSILLDTGVPLRDIQVFLGHANAITTQRYGLDRNRTTASPADTVNSAIAMGKPSPTSVADHDRPWSADR